MPILLALLLLTTPGELAPAELEAWLGEVRLAEEGFAGRLARVVSAGVGTPYENGPLGEGPEGKYDTDPLMDLSRVDCVTFVEQSVALAASSTRDEAFALLQRIRYRAGRIDYESRNHFMVTDWLRNNPWCVDVSAKLGVPTEAVTRTISRRAYFERVKAPELGRETADETRTIRVVPPAQAGAAARAIRAPSLIIFVGHVDWLFALHTGVYLPGKEGAGHLYHASSKAGAVVEADLAAYVASQGDRYAGLLVCTLGEPRWAAAERGDA